MQKQTKVGERMPRQRSPDRNEAQAEWIESRGKISAKSLSEKYGVPESRIRKWKSVDKWQEKLLEKYPPRRGAQPGNKNAKGNGAPKRNQNAKTHGAYCSVFFDELTDQEKELRDSLTANVQDNLMREYQTLVIKENRLKKEIARLEAEAEGELFVDTVTVMETPKTAEELQADKMQEAADVAAEYYIPEAEVYISKRPMTGEKLHMRITNSSSAFNRKMKLEEVLIKTHGRIIKILETMRGYETEQRRLDIEEEKLRLAMCRITGEFNTDDTPEVVDESDYDLLFGDEEV